MDETGLTLRRAEVRPGVLADIRLERGRVVAVEPTSTGSERGGPVADLAGRAVLPGLVDHHIHLLALAAAEESVDCAPPAVTSKERPRAGT